MTADPRSLPARHRAALFRSSGGACALCGEPLGHGLHADHRQPWAITGITNPHDMQALCPPCNMRKGASMLRKHQAEADAITTRPDCGSRFKDVLAAVTPGGGKSALPVIFAHRLRARGMIDRVLWVVPRDSLREQAERAFLDRTMRGLLGHDLEVRAAGNDIDPARGTAGYVTTYQAIAADPELHAHELRRARYLLCLDEAHHVAEGSLWHRALQLLMERAAFRLVMTGTASRADGKRIAFLPYRDDPRNPARQEVDLSPIGPTHRVIRYTRRDALDERAILPIYFERVDAEVEWIDRRGDERRISSFKGAARETGDALFSALSQSYARELLQAAVEHWQGHRETHNPRAKLLVVAPSIGLARRYLGWLGGLGVLASDIATSDDSDAAKRAIKRFKGESRDEPPLDALVTVAMAYEGMDCPAVTHLVCLTHIRSAEWIEQMLARATRVDRHAGPYHEQAAHVWAPDDDLFSECIARIVEEQAGVIEEREKVSREAPERGLEGSDLVPMRAAATAIRAQDMQSGAIVGAAEVKRAKEAMSAGGLRGASVFQFLAAMRAFQEREPVEDAADLSPGMTASEREANLRAAIDRRIKRYCAGNPEAIKEWNLRAIRALGVRREEMSAQQLQELWKLLGVWFGDAAEEGAVADA